MRKGYGQLVPDSVEVAEEMKTATLLWIIGVSVVAAYIVPSLFGIATIVNGISILVWVASGYGRGGGGSSFEEYDHWSSGDFDDFGGE